jgi:hypothetical protein
MKFPNCSFVHCPFSIAAAMEPISIDASTWEGMLKANSMWRMVYGSSH